MISSTLKREYPTENKLMIILFKICAFIVAIPLVFIYVPIRWIIKKIAGLILFILNIITKNKENAVTRFLNYLVVPHSYKGNNLFIQYLDKYIVGEKSTSTKKSEFYHFSFTRFG